MRDRQDPTLTEGRHCVYIVGLAFLQEGVMCPHFMDVNTEACGNNQPRVPW